MAIKFELLDKRMTPLMLGYLPDFLSVHDPRSAKQQLDANYAHGGGWQPFEGFKLDPTNMALKYPGDPPMLPLAKANLRDEVIYFYPHEWVLVMHHGVWEVCRMD